MSNSTDDNMLNIPIPRNNSRILIDFQKQENIMKAYLLPEMCQLFNTLFNFNSKEKVQKLIPV